METSPIPFGGTCPQCHSSVGVLVTPGHPDHPIPTLTAACPECGTPVALAPIAP